MVCGWCAGGVRVVCGWCAVGVRVVCGCCVGGGGGAVVSCGTPTPLFQTSTKFLFLNPPPHSPPLQLWDVCLEMVDVSNFGDEAYVKQLWDLFLVGTWQGVRGGGVRGCGI